MNVRVHDRVGFTISPGETYDPLGPNGAGEPVSGSASAAKAHIGYVPQEVAPYPDLTARENLRVWYV